LKAKKTAARHLSLHRDVGLRGILETGQLWLTDVFSLNDPSELNHGFSLLLKALLNKAVSPDAKNFAQGLVDFSSG